MCCDEVKISEDNDSQSCGAMCGRGEYNGFAMYAVYVEGLNATRVGDVGNVSGVHIHAGESCDTDTQGPHYLKPNKEDPWFNAGNFNLNPAIAPVGAGYATNDDDTGYTTYAFGSGYVFLGRLDN